MASFTLIVPRFTDFGGSWYSFGEFVSHVERARKSLRRRCCLVEGLYSWQV